MDLNVLGIPTLQPFPNVTELARAYMELGKVTIIDHNYANVEEYFTNAAPVWKAISGYSKLHMYIPFHMVWVGFVSRKANTENKIVFPKHCMTGKRRAMTKRRQWSLRNVEDRLIPPRTLPR